MRQNESSYADSMVNQRADKSTPRRSRLNGDEELGLLLPLLPFAPHLYIEDNVMKTTLQFETPVNQYGIPQRELLVYQLIGSVASDHVWTGYYDLHHIANPRSDYLRKGGEWNPYSAAAQFRNTESLMVRQVRQLHMYAHLMVRKPQMLDDTVHEAFLHEHGHMKYLYRIVNITHEEAIAGRIDPRLEETRGINYQVALRGTQPSEVGHLPKHDFLASLTVAEARAFLQYKLQPLNLRALGAYAWQSSPDPL